MKTCDSFSNHFEFVFDLFDVQMTNNFIECTGNSDMDNRSQYDVA